MPPWLVVALLIGLLALLNAMLAPREGLHRSATSYGEVPEGFGALFASLVELKQRPERSRTRYVRVGKDRPLWLLAPRGRPGPPTEPRESDGGHGQRSGGGRSGSVLSELESWARSGGTAVLLGSRPEPGDWPARLGLSFGPPLAVPDLRATGDLAGTGALRRLHTAEADEARGPTEASRGAVGGRGPKRAPTPPPFRGFLPPGEAAGDAKVLLWGQDEEGRRAALVVELRRGEGRLVVVSDARWLDNAHLAKLDDALLAADLIRAYGAPRIDERCHGLAAIESLPQALGAVRSILACLAVLGVALPWLWSRRTMPPRTLEGEPQGEGGLGRYVQSLALLYGRHLPGHCAEAYEAYFRGWVHRHGPIAPPGSAERRPRSRGELGEAVRALESAAEAHARRGSCRGVGRP